jgi:hypothetical protein
MRFTVLHIAVLLCGCASSESVPGPAQNADPQEILNGVGRRLEIEQQQRFEDGQRQRLLDQQEQAYDRQKCLQAGYHGPDAEQCVRDSAASRRGVRPGQANPSSITNCTTVDLGGGMFDTVCD